MFFLAEREPGLSDIQWTLIYVLYQSVSGLRSCGLWLEHHPRKVLVTAVLVGAQRCANLLAVELVVDVEILLGRRAVRELLC